MKRKTRFKSAQELVEYIDELRWRVKQKRLAGQRLDIEADALFKFAATVHAAELKRSEAKAIFKRANQIEDVTIPAMSKKLAALQTEPMFFIQENAASIPKQPGAE